jgi:hypothetical protein
MRRSLRGPWWLGWLLLALASLAAWGQQPPATPSEKPALSARQEYLRALERFGTGKGGTLESVFTLARAAAREQLQATLEWDEALAKGKVPKRRFERELPGFHVGTSKALYVIADTRAFLELARQRGSAVDRRFFELLHQTFQGSPTRVYVDQIDNVTACFQLGGREMHSLYKGWSQFQASYPNAYKEAVRDELAQLEQVYASATCACGSHEVVDAGLEAFLKAFPKSRIAPQVRSRLEKIHTKTSDIIFRCGQELLLPQPIPPGVGPPTTP